MKKLFLLLLSVLISTQTFAAQSAMNFSALGVGGGGGFSNVDSFTSDGTWSPPSGIDAVCVRGVAAGGGGGGGTSSTNGSGAGGKGQGSGGTSATSPTANCGAGGGGGFGSVGGGTVSSAGASGRMDIFY